MIKKTGAIQELDVQPFYGFKLNEPYVYIENASISLLDQHTELEGSGKLQMVFFPKVGLEVHADFQDLPKFNRDFEGSSICVNGINVKVSKIDHTLFFGSDLPARVTARWFVLDESVNILGNYSTMCTAVISCLFNFSRVNLNSYFIKKIDDVHIVARFVSLYFEDWVVKIRALTDTYQMIDKLDELGGFGVTHELILFKVDNKEFCVKDACNFLDKISDFLSFLRGAWVNCVSPVGFNEHEEAVWKQLSTPTQGWSTSDSWFNSFHIEQIEELFPKFMHKRCHAIWGEALKSVLPWYFSANDFSKAAELNIIATQAALEKLSYEYAVNYKKLITKNGFKDLWASDKFRLLFASLDIPLDITNDTPEIFIVSKKNQFKWIDAAHALTEIRNAIVHPEHSKKRLIDGLLIEALQLGLRYLELSILAICEYDGTYSSRLRVKGFGAIQQVPWAK